MVVSSKDNGDAIGQILIADDDPEFRQMLARRAIRMGLSVVQAEDGNQAMEAIRSHKFHTLVVDLYMPGHTGLEVIQAAQKVDPELQAIVLTGSATLETAIEALRTGVHDYLTKPLESLAAFELSLTRALEHRFLILENKRLFAEVQRLAVTDPLTGLFNRHKLDEALETEVERASRYGRPLSLIMLDLDKLKRVNDTYGHSAGDSVLEMVAQAIRSELRKLDLAARYGGDEFLVLLPEAHLKEATLVAQRICARIAGISFGGKPISASIGVAQWDKEYSSHEGFLEAADRALYRSKRNGRGRVSVAHEGGSSVVTPPSADVKRLSP